MANFYVYSGAGGGATGADWANAFLTISAAGAACSAGDSIWVASDHAESTAAAITPTFAGTLAAPCRIISVNRAGSVPPVAADILAGAAVTTTGNSAITVAGNFYMYGVTFNCADGANSAALSLGGTLARSVYERCRFFLIETGASGRVNLATQTSTNNSYKDCTVGFGAAGQGLASVGYYRWENGLGIAAIDNTKTIPTTLQLTATNLGINELIGLDLSDLNAGKTINSAAALALMRLTGCKLNASVTVAGTPTTSYGRGAELIGCSSTTAPYRNEKYTARGTLTTETTIVRTGGALGPDSTPVSWKIVTTADAKREVPFRTFEIDIPNTDTGSAKTVTFHTVTDGVTLTDAEAWLEVSYPGSATTPLLYSATDGAATILTAGTGQTASTETWTTTGLGSPVKQQLAVTFTPEMKGLIRCTLVVAKASTTVYVCPLAAVS